MFRNVIEIIYLQFIFNAITLNLNKLRFSYYIESILNR